LRTSVSVRMRRLLGIGVGALLLCAGLAACGSSAPTGTEADPASLAPASSLLYIAVTVRPEGALRQSTITDLRALAHRKEPLGELLQAIAGSGPLGSIDFKREVEPWVGTQAGLFATSGNALANASRALGSALGSGFSPQALIKAGASGLLSYPDTQAALVLDTRNLSQARSFLGKLAGRQGAHSVSYRGVSYDANPQGAAEAIVGKFAVFGDEAGVKQAIDTHLGEPSLKSSSTPYQTLAAKGQEQALAGIYVNPTFARPQRSGEGGTSGGEVGQGERAASAEGQAKALLSALPGEPLQARISIVPRQHAFQIDADLLASSTQAESQAIAASSQAATLLGNLPSSSWLAASVGEGGAHAARYITLLSSVAGLATKSLFASFGGPALEGLLGYLSAHNGKFAAIFSGWNGPAAIFAAGSGLINLQTGLLMQASSTAGARAAVGRIGSQLKDAGASVTPAKVPGAESALTVRITGFPVVLDVGAAAGKLVLGIGPESVQGALSPAGAFSSSSVYSSASSMLGAKPAIVFDVPQSVSLVEGLGLSESPTIAPTLEKLRSLGTIAGGLQGLGGGVLRLRLLAGLQG
jgi:Protein of unknown function (DUF3352)